MSSLTASDLNSPLNLCLVISNLQFLGHDLIVVSTKPAAAQCPIQARKPIERRLRAMWDAAAQRQPLGRRQQINIARILLGLRVQLEMRHGRWRSLIWAGGEIRHRSLPGSGGGSSGNDGLEPLSELGAGAGDWAAVAASVRAGPHSERYWTPDAFASSSRKTSAGVL